MLRQPSFITILYPGGNQGTDGWSSQMTFADKLRRSAEATLAAIRGDGDGTHIAEIFYFRQPPRGM